MKKYSSLSFLLVPFLMLAVAIVSPSRVLGQGAEGGDVTGDGGDDGSTEEQEDRHGTYFMEKGSTLQGYGAYSYHKFTVSRTTRVVFRYVSDDPSDAAIVVPDQLPYFIGMGMFSGFGVFLRQIGYDYVTLEPGTYYVAMRNVSDTENETYFELDYAMSLAADDNFSYSFEDWYITGSRYVTPNGGKLMHGFSIQPGFRYFVDGCCNGAGMTDDGLESYIIPASQLSAFKAGRSFTYYTGYAGLLNSDPGFYEVYLNPGSYYLVFRNVGKDNAKPLTYTMERWRKTSLASGSVQMGGSASWGSITGKKVKISVEKVENLATSGRSGSLRLRLWAFQSAYTGGSGTGYLLATRSLSALKAGYYYASITGYVSYKRPPSGAYYTALILEEYTRTGWQVRDYVNFNGPTQF